MSGNRKTKSMRGTIVDFDLMDIKNQLRTNPAPLNVQQRQNFVDNKVKRRVKRLAEKAAERITTRPVDTTPVEPVQETKVVEDKGISAPKNAIKEIPATKEVVETPKKPIAPNSKTTRKPKPVAKKLEVTPKEKPVTPKPRRKRTIKK